MPPDLDPAQAALRLRDGALIAYPTEAVWGLGCDPRNEAAVARLLALKQRPQAKGVIVIASDIAQLIDWLDLESLSAPQRDAVLASWPGPYTWSIPCTPAVPSWLRGEHQTLAARLTAHPVAAALCRAFGSALVSTSANLAGDPPPRQRTELDPRVLAGVDAVIAGETGALERPTPIRDARSGELLRS